MKKNKRLFILIISLIIFVAVTVSTVLVIKEIKRNPLIGEWTSKDNSIVYEFKDKGEMDIICNNFPLPVIKTKYNGVLDGKYEYNKSEKKLSVTLEVYSKSITLNYNYEINKNILLLTNSTDKSKTEFVCTSVEE